MLNEEICRQCWQHSKSTWANWKAVLSTGWATYKGRRDEEACIWCPIIKNGVRLSTKVKDSPPEWCPYVLEHIIVNENSELNQE